MKMPDLKTIEGVAILAGVAVAVYVAYRVYKTGSGIADTIEETLTKAYHDVDRGLTSVGTRVRQIANGGDLAASPVDDQSAAETARLKRQENDAAYGDDPEPVYDPMTGVQLSFAEGDAGRFYNAPQAYSPEPFEIGTV